MQGVSFNLSITAGSFAFSFDTCNGNRNPAIARSPAKAWITRKSPSTLKRNARRKELFLKKKAETPSSSIPSPQTTETTHSQPQPHCPQSANSIDFENIVIHQDMGNGNWISHPRSHSPINQLDGTSDPCDDDDDDDHSQLNDTESANSDNHSEIVCAMCNSTMTPTHQCGETNKIQPKNLHIARSVIKGILDGFGIPLDDEFDERLRSHMEEMSESDNVK